MFKIPHDDPRLDVWLKANGLDPDEIDFSHFIYTNEGTIHCRIWEEAEQVLSYGLFKAVSKSVHFRTPLMVRWGQE